jgi:hypothetical protein
MKSSKWLNCKELRLENPVSKDQTPHRRVRGTATAAEESESHGHGGESRIGGQALSMLTPRPGSSLTELWRFQRDMVIYLAHSHGISQRILANVFDLPQSRISAIVRGINFKLNMEQAPRPRGFRRGGVEGRFDSTHGDQENAGTTGRGSGR